jgi:hypothetical protein
MFGFRGEKAASAKPFLARWIVKIKSLHLIMENQMGGPPENLGHLVCGCLFLYSLPPWNPTSSRVRRTTTITCTLPTPQLKWVIRTLLCISLPSFNSLFYFPDACCTCSRLLCSTWGLGVVLPGDWNPATQACKSQARDVRLIAYIQENFITAFCA